MGMLRANTSTIVRSLAIASAIGLLAASPARAQYPFGPGFAYPGYGGYGYGGYGYGYGGYGPGFVGGNGFGPAVYSNMGFGVGTVATGYGSVMAGYAAPIYGTGYPMFGYGFGAPGYGPSGIGYVNPLFSLGLSPLAVQTAIAEQSLRGTPIRIERRVSQPATSAPNPAGSGATGTNSTPPPR